MIDHIGIAVSDMARSRVFCQAALAADGRNSGAPGLRALYHPDDYGAFVSDPDGHHIEAVCHGSA